MNEFINNNINLDKTITKDYILKFGYPEILSNINNIISSIDKSQYKEIKTGVYVGENVIISDSATIIGPCIIGDNTEIRVNAFIRENVIIGKNCVIGNSCELKNSIVFDSCQIPHFNYIGDSILGYKVHFGAGSITSNLKSDNSNVVLKVNNNSLITNKRKVGSIVGDNTEIGCNSVLAPGTVIGSNSVIYPLTFVRGEILANRIVKSMTNIVSKNENISRL